MKFENKAEWADFYKKNGFCVVESLLTPEECRFYLQKAEETSRDQPEQYVPRINPDRKYPEFRKLLCHPKVVACLEILQESRVHGLQSMLYYKPPGQLGRDVHQDNHYAKAAYGAYIGSWMPLEDSDRENGGLLAYPGSHVEPLLNIVADPSRAATNAGGFKNDRGTPCTVPEKYKKIYLSVPAGACVFIHGHLIHGSEENTSKTRFRRVFAGHYIKEGVPFVAGTHAKREVIDVYGGK